MEQEPQEVGYSREAFEAVEQQLKEAMAQKERFPDDPSYDEDIEGLSVERQRLLDLAHEEALEENTQRDTQGELPLG